MQYVSLMVSQGDSLLWLVWVLINEQTGRLRCSQSNVRRNFD
jgi:hypothetical protein